MKGFIETGFERACPGLTWKFYELPFENNGGCEILRIKFNGKYECSDNHSYSRLIAIIVRAGVEFWNPSKVILDYSDLEFNGGDEFERTYDAVNNEYIPTVLIVGDKCRKAMSEIAWNGEDKDIVDNSFFFDDCEKALIKLKSA